MRSYVILSVLLYLSLSSHAAPGPSEDESNADPKRWRNGFIVTMLGDTVAGKVKIIDYLDVYYDYQRKLTFKDQKGINQYLPYELNSFSYYENRDSVVTLQSVSSPEGDGHVFLRLYYTGTCKAYGLTITEAKTGGMGPGEGAGLIHSSLFHTEKKYIQIGGSQFYRVTRIGFKKNMKELFASCPRILNGLESKQYTIDNWQVMAKDYNCGCK